YPSTRDFLARHNPDALRDMAERMLEAQQRGLCQEPGEYRQAREDLLLDIQYISCPSLKQPLPKLPTFRWPP
ncbi:cobaltochelatase subunit CobN, partial [Pseudomonas syringae pv. tagetis]|uniref:cobaltochelatase subunit CobN n=1 Tax=Pseudomonas syringae group genomosp. 7 TaxID=251699 RepID=UPI0037702D9B